MTFDGRRARRARGGRRLDPDRRPLAPALDLPRPGRVRRDREHSRSSSRPCAQDWVTAALAVVVGVAGIGSRGCSTARAGGRCRTRPRSSGRSSTSSTSTRRTTSSSTGRPRRSGARWNRWVERPLIGGSLNVLARGTRGARRPASAASRPGSCARYALAVAGRRRRSWPSSSSRRDDDRARSSSRSSAALVVWLLPLPRFWAGSLALLVSLVEVGLWVNALRSASTSTRAGSSTSSRRRGSATSASPTTSACTGSRSGSSALTVVRDGGRGRLRVLGRPRAGARVLRADAVPHRRDRRRLRAQDLLLFYAVVRGDADPAVRARRRLGRRGAARRDDQVRHLHDGRLAADAGVDRRLRPLAGHVRPRRVGDERRATGSSSASSSPSRSRRRCSRSTAGCPTRTARRRRRSPAVLSGSSRRRPCTGFLRIVIAKFPEPVEDCAHRDPRARVASGSSTARCSRSARPTCAA